MSASARQYHTRIPRYVLKAEDESFMRFAGMGTRGVAARARVRDLSENGVAFTLGGTDAPEEGDVLKIEFTIPGRSQIACFATVVRVEPQNDWDPDLGTREYTLIACQFRNLPTPYIRALSNGLKGKTQQEPAVNWAQEAQSRALSVAGIGLSLFLTLGWLAAPASSWIALFR